MKPQDSMKSIAKLMQRDIDARWNMRKARQSVKSTDSIVRTCTVIEYVKKNSDK